MFGIDTHHRADHSVLLVGGELDLATAPAFRTAAVAAVATGVGPVLIDLTACDHVDSVGAGLLLGVLKRCRAAGRALVVVCPDERLRRVLDLTELSRIVPVVPSVEAALALDPPTVGAAARPSRSD